MVNDSYNFEPESPVVIIAMPTLGTIITLMNGGVLAILLTDRELRQDMYSVVLLSLSVCDLLVGLSMLFYSLASHIDMLRNLISCVSSLFFMMSTVCLSNAQILYICVVRVISVKYPHSFRSIFSLKRHGIYTSVLSLTMFIVFAIPTALWVGNPDEIIVKCSSYTAFKPIEGMLLLVGSVLLSTYIATLVCYVHLIRILRKRISPQAACVTVPSIESRSNRAMSTITKSDLTPSDQNAKENRTETSSRYGNRTDTMRTDSRREQFGETVRTLGAIIGVMSLLVIPSSLSILVEGMVPSVTLSLSVRAFMAVLTSFNSLLNPFVYPLTMRKFQAALRRRFKYETRH